MYLHLGNNVIIKKSDIIGIFDIDKTTVSKRTRDFLAHKEKEGKTRYITEELPQSFIICVRKNEEQVFISQISGATLRKRMKTNDYQEEKNGTTTRL